MKKKAKKKARMGRPPKGDDARKVFVGVKVTPRELKAWKASAKAESVSLSEWLLAPRRDKRS